MRGLIDQIVAQGGQQLGIAPTAVERLIAHGPALLTQPELARYSAVATTADAVLNRRPLGSRVVDNFYTVKRGGGFGEELFVRGDEALALHNYPERVTRTLPAECRARFFGLGNVWDGVTDIEGATILDVGSGSGADLGAAAALSSSRVGLIGMDKRPDLLGIAREACPAASLVIGDICESPFLPDTFDLVLANGLPPLQRPISLGKTARALVGLVRRGGMVSATVIVTSPTVEELLVESLPDIDPALARGFACLVSGKPLVADVMAAFGTEQVDVVVREGNNPYRSEVSRRQTALVHVRAVRR